jgi:hypothetical protein
VVALGSSRTAIALRGELLAVNRRPGPGPIVFNAGMCKFLAVGQLLTACRLFDEGIRPDVVLLEVWPPFLAHGGDQTDTLVGVERLNWHEQQLLHQHSVDPVAWQRNWLTGLVCPLAYSRPILLNRYAGVLVAPGQHFSDNWNGMNDWGWAPMRIFDGTVSPGHFRQAVERGRGAYTPLLASFTVSPSSDRALRQLLARLRQEGARVAFSLLPEPEALRGWYTAQSRQDLHRYLEELGREFGTAVLDMRQWVSDSGFHECVHLTHEGARQFTGRFERDALPGILSGELWSAGSPW